MPSPAQTACSTFGGATTTSRQPSIPKPRPSAFTTASLSAHWSARRAGSRPVQASSGAANAASTAPGVRRSARSQRARPQTSMPIPSSSARVRR